MPIYGDLKSMPLPDLLPMLGRRNGVLEMNNLMHYGRLHLTLERGIVRRLEHNSVTLDRVQARAALLEISNDMRGNFRFNQDVQIAPRPNDLNWSLEKVLLGLATQTDEQQHHLDSLPDPEIVFEAVQLEPILEEPLWSFWQRSKDALVLGVSARKLAVQLNIPERQVQFFLYKLRVSGKVSPVRAAELQTQVRLERQSIASRLLGAIFRRSRA
ncbi:MAG: DUF4388 domain-containing protein [Pleurocapsa sp. SU_196_0]|nr:DUF4388 domain-containing protein [Pleurocapsa sp. SU_196_0]